MQATDNLNKSNLDKIRSDDKSILSNIKSRLNNTLEKTCFDFLGEKYEGKVRDNYTRGDERIIITTDRVSAFDVVLGTIPLKGQVLNQLASFWFSKTKDIVRNHIISMPDPNVLVVKEVKTFPVEVVVRGYLTGSALRDYLKGERMISGVNIPEGMKKDQKFNNPIITPSTKAQMGVHDEPISRDEIINQGLVPEEMWVDIEKKALQLFARGSEIAKKQGLILVDTKYEFGYDDQGIMLIDEIHTQDSSRYWVSESYNGLFEIGKDQKMLDKEHLRQWLISKGFSGKGVPPKLTDEIKIEAALKYIESFERITGERFKFYNGNVNERIERNLKQNGYI